MLEHNITHCTVGNIDSGDAGELSGAPDHTVDIVVTRTLDEVEAVVASLDWRICVGLSIKQSQSLKSNFDTSLKFEHKTKLNNSDPYVFMLSLHLRMF